MTMDWNANNVHSPVLKQVIAKVCHLQTNMEQLQPDAALSLFPYMTHLFATFASTVNSSKQENSEKCADKEVHEFPLKPAVSTKPSKKQFLCACRLILLACPTYADPTRFPLHLPVSQHHWRGSLPASCECLWESLDDLRHLVLSCFAAFPLDAIGYDFLLHSNSNANISSDSSSLRLLEDLSPEEVQQLVASPATTLFIQPHTFLIFPMSQDESDCGGSTALSLDASPGKLANRKRKLEQETGGSLTSPNHQLQDSFSEAPSGSSHASPSQPQTTIAPRPGNQLRPAPTTPIGIPKSLSPPTCLHGVSHELCRIPPTKKKMRPTKRCEQCRRASDTRKESRYYCAVCDKGFHRECFLQYHREAGCTEYKVLIDLEPIPASAATCGPDS